MSARTPPPLQPQRSRNDAKLPHGSLAARVKSARQHDYQKNILLADGAPARAHEHGTHPYRCAHHERVAAAAGLAEKASPTAPTADARAAESARLTELNHRVKDRQREFPTAEGNPAETEPIGTMREITPGNEPAQWAGVWPPLRELIQNTCDAMRLTGSHGGLPIDVRMVCRQGLIVFFTAADRKVLAVFAFEGDQLRIFQTHQYALNPKRVLMTGVKDKSKKGSQTQAGGFGDGFKEAVRILMGRDACLGVAWRFYSPEGLIEWLFKARGLAESADYASGAELVVSHLKTSFGRGVAPESCAPASYVMEQCISYKGIGAAFLSEVVPRCQVFWAEQLLAHEPTVLRAPPPREGNWLCDAAALPAAAAVLGVSAKPGIYIKGLWIREPHSPKTITACMSGVNVNGRDRTDADENGLGAAVAAILTNPAHKQAVRALFAPVFQHRKSRTWLTRGTEAKDYQIIHQAFSVSSCREKLVHDVLGYDRGALVLNESSVDKESATAKWRSSFLKWRGVHVVVVSPRTNNLKQTFSLLLPKADGEQEVKHKVIVKLLELAGEQSGQSSDVKLATFK